MSDLPSNDISETESVKSDTKSTASITKPSCIKPPAVHTTRIGRPCCAGHTPKPGIPHQEPKNNNMRRQSDDYSRSHLSDVFEESEADLIPERSPRSIKSKSPDSFTSKTPKSDRKISNGSTNSDLYMEATGRRHSSDQGNILTTDTDSFIIGQRIWVGGIRPGLIAYIGETHFAPGEWAGVVLDDPNGKNDGCVAGKRYFQCEPKRGIFSRLTRLTRDPLPGGATSTSDLSMNVSSRSITSPSRSGTVSPTQSMKSFSGKTPSKTNLAVGDRVIVSSGMGSRPGVLQYIGETKFAAGNWCGIQLDEPTGKNDGSVDGVKYFDCPAQYGIFVPLAKVSLSPSARKPRLSRAGSKESLTSVGTLGSIASTATSRLRMSAQRLSSTAKPITTPKNTFSLQEVLREKQNHIEHLLIERDLDRQDSENNSMMYQKTINQLKETITSLEKQLTSEKQKSEDLQTSVDEASFCTDELNVAIQEYKDRVAVLEAQGSGNKTTDENSSFEDDKRNEEISRLRKQCELLNTNLAEKQSALQVVEEKTRTLESDIESNLVAHQATTAEYISKISSLESTQKSLQDQVQHLTQQNESTKSDLMLRDETNEREFLNVKHIENELREEVEALTQEIKLREAASAESAAELQKVIEAKETIIADQGEAAVGSEHLHLMIVKQKDEEMNGLKKANESLSNENAKFIQEINQNATQTDTLQKNVDESAKLLLEKEGRITELLATNAPMSEAVEKYKNLETELREQIQVSTQSLTESEKRKSELAELLANRDKCVEELQGLSSDHTNKFQEMTTRSEALQGELNKLKSDNAAKDENYAKLSNELKNVTNELNEKCLQWEDSQKSLSSSVEESKALTEQISVLNAEIEQLKATLDSNLSSLAKIVDLEDAHKSDMQIVDNLNKDIQTLNSQINALTAGNSTLSEDLKNTQTALESTKLENVSQLNAINETKQEIERLQTDLHAKNEAFDKIQHANGNLQSKLDEALQNGSDVQDKFSKLEVEYGDLNRKMALIEEKCEQLSLEKTSLQQNIQALQNSSSDTSSEVHRLSTELQQKQKSYEELVDKSNSIQLSLEKRLHETTQNLAATTSQWERVKNEMETVTLQKIDRENELNVELARMKESATEEKRNLVNETEALKASYQEEKARLLNEIDMKLKDSDALNSQIQNLEKVVNELQITVETAKKDALDREAEFEARTKDFRTVQEDLEKQLAESNRKESELRNVFDEVSKSKGDSVQQLEKQLTEKSVYSKTLESSVKELQATIDKATAEHNELKTKLLAVEKVNEDSARSHQEEKESFAQIKSNLEQQLLEASSKFKSVEDDQVDLVNRNVELTQKIAELTGTVMETSNSKTETAAELAKLQSEFEAFKLSALAEKCEIESRLADSHKKEIEFTENVKSLESQNGQLLLTIEDKQKELDAISSKLREANDEYEVQKTKAATFSESTHSEILALRNEAAEHIKTIQSLESTIDQLKSSVNLSDDLKNELNHKSKEIESKESKIFELHATIDALKQQMEVKEGDWKRLVEEKEVETNRSMDDMASKQEEIKSIHLQLETMKKAAEGKTEEFTSLTDERSSLVSAKNSLDEEISRLNNEMKNYAENFVARTELDNLKEEFSIYEETKRTEIADLSKKLVALEERLKNQTTGMDKLGAMEREQKDIAYEKTALQRREAQLVLENKQLADKLLQMKANSSPAPQTVSDDDTGAQISFLNSIIADMQRKNETLTHRIQALESGPSDFVNNGLFDLPVKRKPAPRLFCDICDEFDAHETEDCPLQSDSPSPITVPEMTSTANLISKDAPKERKLPPPRKFCDHCEVFGHDATECENEETY